MKKLIYCIALLAFFSSTYAQKPLEMQIGLYQTWGLSSLDNDEFPINYYTTSFLQGGGLNVALNYNWKSHWVLQGALGYAKQPVGFANYGDCGTPPIALTPIFSHNIEIQSNLRFLPLGQKKWSPFIGFGLSQFIHLRGDLPQFGLEWPRAAATPSYPSYSLGFSGQLGVKFPLFKTCFMDLSTAIRHNPFYEKNLKTLSLVQLGFGFSL